MDEITLAAEEAGQTLAAVLRAHLGLSWSLARALCERGKVYIGDSRATDSAQRLTAGTTIVLNRAAPRLLSERAVAALAAVVFEDSQLIVIDKPAGISSVPYERGESDTAMDLIRAAWRADGRSATDVPLHIVHRIDKETSGLLLFAKTKRALRELQARWRLHDIERRYLCVAHGRLSDRRIESYFVDDRGDGLRGTLGFRPGGMGRQLSARPHSHGGVPAGKQAITFVQLLEPLGELASLCAITLETGKTHQIRIHLSEAGHPIVGEQVYIRDYLARGSTPLPSPRLLLHAETLGFVHPTTGEQISLQRPPPVEFLDAAERLRRQAARAPSPPTAAAGPPSAPSAPSLRPRSPRPAPAPRRPRPRPASRR
jgi:23S rRNA pseudouridine1911/1915/1917 synthase